MKNLCSCIQCRREFSNKGLFTHIDRSHGTSTEKAKYSSGYNGKYDILSSRANIIKQQKNNAYMLAPNYCRECNSIIPFENKSYKFCNHTCSAIYSNRAREKAGWVMSLEARKNISIENTGRVYTKLTKVTCCRCNLTFDLDCRSGRDLSKVRCDACIRISRLKVRSAKDTSKLKDYRLACKFRFSLNKYPDAFDFTLIEEYGWYKAANHGNNLYGVSRDHMVSVRYGFDNNIDPNTIAHPANCKLMRHSLNIKKYTDNSITYDELLIKIKEWDLRYPKFRAYNIK